MATNRRARYSAPKVCTATSYDLTSSCSRSKLPLIHPVPQEQPVDQRGFRQSAVGAGMMSDRRLLVPSVEVHRKSASF